MNPLLTLGLIVLGLVVLDVFALRFGADSRRLAAHPGNWW